MGGRVRQEDMAGRSCSVPQPLFDPRFVVFPERLPPVVVRNTFENASDKGIVRGPLPGPTPEFFCKSAFRPTALTDGAPYNPTRVEGADGEAGSDTLRPNSLHHFANGRTRPDSIFIGRSPRQYLTDILIADSNAPVFRAEASRLNHPP